MIRAVTPDPSWMLAVVLRQACDVTHSRSLSARTLVKPPADRARLTEAALQTHSYGNMRSWPTSSVNLPVTSTRPAA